MDAYHIFAWQGFSCEIPADWNLAGHTVAGGVSQARFHDDFSLRLDLEWMEARRPIDADVIRRRYDKIAASMGRAGARAEKIDLMPQGWSAGLYTMPNGMRLAAAFRLAPNSPFFWLARIYFEQAGEHEARRIVRRIADSFKLHQEGLAQWAVYDVAFHLRQEFRLEATSFHAGRKLLVFEWRRRRLYLLFFSLADLLCKDQPMERWCAAYLNNFKALSGVTFTEGRSGELLPSHRWWKLWGNLEPLARGCLRYSAWCRLIPEKNQIFLGVLNYRRPDDLAFLAHGLDPALAPR